MIMVVGSVDSVVVVVVVIPGRTYTSSLSLVKPSSPFDSPIVNKTGRYGFHCQVIEYFTVE